MQVLPEGLPVNLPRRMGASKPREWTVLRRIPAQECSVALDRPVVLVCIFVPILMSSQNEVDSIPIGIQLAI